MSWPMVALGKVAPYTPLKNQTSEENPKIWHLTLDQVESNTGNIIEYDYRPLSEAGPSTHWFNENHVLYSKLRPYLNKVVVPEYKGLCTTELVPLLPNVNLLDRKYLTYYLRSPYFVQWVSEQTAGAKMPRVSMKLFWEHQLPLPPLETQKQIAAVLEKADQLRKDCQQLEKELNSLAQSVFIDMFGDVTNKETLSKHLQFITSGSRGWAKYYSDSGRRFIRSLDVQMNHISQTDIAYVQPPKGKETERTKVENGDVLLTITGSRIGRASWIPPGFGDAHISQHVALLRLKDTLLPEFLSFYMSLDEYGQRQIAKSQYGQTKPGLKLDHIKEFVIPKLSVDEQQKFVDYMYKLMLVISHNREQLQGLNANFKSLMQKAFQGELNLNKALIENISKPG